MLILGVKLRSGNILGILYSVVPGPLASDVQEFPHIQGIHLDMLTRYLSQRNNFDTIVTSFPLVGDLKNEVYINVSVFQDHPLTLISRRL